MAPNETDVEQQAVAIQAGEPTGEAELSDSALKSLTGGSSRFRIVRQFGRAGTITVGCLVSTFLVAMILAVPGVAVLGVPDDPNDMGLMIVSMIAFSVAALFVTNGFLRTTEATSLRDAGLPIKWSGGKKWVAGFAMGFLTLTVIAAFYLAAGVAGFRRLENTSPNFGIVALWVCFFAVQSMGEEAIFRGFLLRLWTRSVNFPVGLLSSSALFSLGHLGNPGAGGLALFHTLLAGMTLGLIFERTGSLWLAGGIHAGWNVAQPIFGLNMSGYPIRILSYEMDIRAGTLWTGGEYGLEASLPVTILTAGLTGWLVYRRGSASHSVTPVSSHRPDLAECKTASQTF